MSKDLHQGYQNKYSEKYGSTFSSTGSIEFITEAGRLKLRKDFNLMNINRMKFLENQQNQKRKDKVKRAMSPFKPSISPKTSMLAQSVRKRENQEQYEHLHDYLIEKGKDYDLNKLIQHERKTEIEVQKCTFKPTLSENTQKMVKVTNLPIFQRLTQKYNSEHSSKNASPPKSPKEEKKHKFTAKKPAKPIKNSRYCENESPTKSTTSENAYKMEVDEDSVTTKNVSSNEYENGTVPQLFIDVHLDDMSIHRLTIFEGDDPQVLASNFCEKYGKLRKTNSLSSLDLDQSMMKQLVQIIHSQMNKLLNTIDEGEDEE